MKDTKNFLGSKNLISHAIETGLYDPDSGEPFNVAKVYATQTGKKPYGMPAPEYDRRRIWRAISLLKPSANFDPEEPSWFYPLFIKPDKKLTPKDLLAVLNDHYEGTEYDHYGLNRDQYDMREGSMTSIGAEPGAGSQFQINEKRQYQYAPIWGTERLIGNTRSVTNYCVQLRGWMPNPIGGLLWAAIGGAETSVRIPWYSGITRTPEPFTIGTAVEGAVPTHPFIGCPYNEKSAYWTFKVISNLVNLFYTATKDEVIPIWREWEEKLYELQPAIEKVALELYETDPDLAKEFLTTYSCAKANEALDMAKKITTRLHTIMAHYGSPI